MMKFNARLFTWFGRHHGSCEMSDLPTRQVPMTFAVESPRTGAVKVFVHDNTFRSEDGIDSVNYRCADDCSLTVTIYND